MLVINKKWHHLPNACASALSRICLLQQCDDGQLLNNPPQKKEHAGRHQKVLSPPTSDTVTHYAL